MSKKTPYIPYGVDSQGRVIPSYKLIPKDTSSDYGLEEDQTDSADYIVFPIIITATIAVAVIGFYLWEIFK